MMQFCTDLLRIDSVSPPPFSLDSFYKESTGKTREGMGFHSGREYKSFLSRVTNGCIRCEPDFFPAMADAIEKYGSWNTSIVQNNGTPREPLSPINVTPIPIVPIPIMPPTVGPLPTLPGGSTTPPSGKIIIPEPKFLD